MGLATLLEKVGILEVPEPSEYLVYNVYIGIGGWRGPFKTKHELKRMFGLMEEADKTYEGLFCVTNSGRLIKGYEKGLHIFKGEVDLSEIYPGERKAPHVHWEKGHFLDDIIKGGKIFFKEEKKRFERRKQERELAKYIEFDVQEPKPLYTLNGFYSLLPDQEPKTKINALVDRLDHEVRFEDEGKFSKFKEDSIASETLKLKLFENKYRRLVSDQ
ncbi:hypothetical protein GOV06_02395 [Candidatus Woesearchaeota archaeon]|nr:hypothetical protein [Candidatus Woesearchaeota archaeon]